MTGATSYAVIAQHAFVAHTGTSPFATCARAHTHTHTHTHTHARANSPTRLMNIIGVPTLVHINYGLRRLEKASIYTDNFLIETKSIIST